MEGEVKMADKLKWKIGQDIIIAASTSYLVESVRPDKITTAKITKVGRKWVTVDDCPYHPSRFDAETRCFDGPWYCDTRKAYASLEEYEAENGLRAAWLQLRNYTDNARPPEHLTREDVEGMVRKIAKKEA